MKIKEVMSIQTFFLLEVFIPISYSSCSGTLMASRFGLEVLFLRECPDDQIWKNFDFKPHVYLPYLRSYGHF